jgi:hypothetical protein
MAKRAKPTELVNKALGPGRAIKRGNDIRIVLKPKGTGWKGITLNFEKEVFKCRSLNKSELEIFLEEDSGWSPM